MPATHSGDTVLEDKLHFACVLVNLSQEACMPLWRELASKPELWESYHLVQTPLSLMNQVLTHHFDANCWSITSFIITMYYFCVCLGNIF